MVQRWQVLSLREKVIAITRPREQAKALADIIVERKGIPIIAPTVEIKPAPNLQLVEEFLDILFSGRVDVVIFMSRNGVTSLFEASERTEKNIDLVLALNRTINVAVGPKTKEVLEKIGIRVNHIPSEFSSIGVMDIMKKLDLKGKIVAIPRNEFHNNYLKLELERYHAIILEVPVYTTALPVDKKPVLSLIKDMLENKVDIITFTSSSSVNNLFKIADEAELVDALRQCLNGDIVVATIGPVTKQTLEYFNVKIPITPKKYTIEAMVDSLENYLSMI